MTFLLADPPLAVLDERHGPLTLAACDPGPAWWLAPWRGHEAAFSEALAAATGLAFPRPGEASERAGQRLLWCGRAQALLLGGPAPQGLTDHGAVIDQTDGWAALDLTGPGWEDVLARLVPVDMRPARLPEGRTIRSLLGHMTAQITPRGAGAEILVMRSMAATAAEEIASAMRRVAARA